MKENKMLKLIPVMLCFFAMGFVDLVGIASNYVKEDLNLSNSSANIFPSLVFFWFLIFSVPTGMLMNKIGRKNTVLLSLLITVLSLLIPIFGETYFFFLIRNWECLDANISESTYFEHYLRRQAGQHIDIRPICQGYRFFHGSINCRLGSASFHSCFRIKLESAFPHLYDCRHLRIHLPITHINQGRRDHRESLHLRRMLQTARETDYSFLIPWNHVSCGHRCWY